MDKFLLISFVVACVGDGRRMQSPNAQFQKQQHIRESLSRNAGHTDSSWRSLFHSSSMGHAAAKGMDSVPASISSFLLALSPAMSTRLLRKARSTPVESSPRVRRNHVQMTIPTSDLQAPGTPGANALTFHRWVAEDQDSAVVACQTPKRFEGGRIAGTYPGSSRVHFTLPGIGEKTLELLWSLGDSNPAFSAVKVKLPFEATVFSRQSRVVVNGIKEHGSAEAAGIQVGDIIRAISLPPDHATDHTTDGMFSTGIGGVLFRVPEVENGMIVLEENSVAHFQSVLKANLRANIDEAVLVVERPIRAWDDFDNEEYVLKASSSYADMVDSNELGNLMPEKETTKSLSSTVYISKIPFNTVLDGADTLLQNMGFGDMYPSLLEHTMVLVQHDGEKGCTAYDFTSRDNYVERLTLPSLATALAGHGFAGDLRKFKLRRIPRRSGTRLIGKVRASLGSPAEIDRAIEDFRNKYDNRMVLLQHDCRHYAEALQHFLIER